MTMNLLLCLLPILLTLVQCRCETRNEQELRRLRNVARTEVPATLKLLIDGNDAELKSLFLVNGQEVPGFGLQGSGQSKTQGNANVRQIGDSTNNANPSSTQTVGSDGNPKIMNEFSLPSGISEDSNGYANYFTGPQGGYSGLGGNQFMQFPGYGAGGQWSGGNGGFGSRPRSRLRRILGRVLGGTDSSPLGLALGSRAGAGGDGGVYSYGLGGPLAGIGAGNFGGLGLGRGSGWGSGILGGSRFGLGGGNGGLGSGWLQGLGFGGGPGGGRMGYGMVGDGIGVQGSGLGGGEGVQYGGGFVSGGQGYRGGSRPGGELGFSGVEGGDLQGSGSGRVRPGGGLVVTGGEGGDIQGSGRGRVRPGGGLVVTGGEGGDMDGSGRGRVRPGVGLGVSGGPGEESLGFGGGRVRPVVGVGVSGGPGGESQVYSGGRGRPGVGFAISDDGDENGLEFNQGGPRGPRRRYSESGPGNNGDSVGTVSFNNDGVSNTEPGRTGGNWLTQNQGGNGFGVGPGTGGMNYSPDSVGSMSWKTSPSDLIYTYGDQIEPLNRNSNSNANYQLMLDDDEDDSEERPGAATVQSGDISTNLDTPASVQPNGAARDLDASTTTSTSTSTTDPNGKRSRQYRIMVMNNGGSNGGDLKSGQGQTSSWTSMLPGSTSGSQGFQMTSPLTEASKTITNIGTPGSSMITSTSGSSVASDPSGTLNKIIRLIPIGNNNS